MTKMEVKLDFTGVLFTSSYTQGRFICDGLGNSCILSCVINDYFKKVASYPTAANKRHERGFSIFRRWRESVYRYFISRLVRIEPEHIKISLPKQRLKGLIGNSFCSDFVLDGASIDFTIRCFWFDW